MQHDRGWWGGRESVGREKMLSGIASFRKAYPDLKCALTLTPVKDTAP